MDLLVPSPVDDHHHLILDAAGKKWTIHSEEGTPLDLPRTAFDVLETAFVEAVKGQSTLAQLKGRINEFAETSWKNYKDKSPQRDAANEASARNAYFGDLLQGLGVMALGKSHDAPPAITQG